MNSRAKISLAAISGVPFVLVLGNSMIIPVLPAIKEILNLSQLQVSLIITLFSVPAGLIIPLAGLLSDRFGRKKVIIPALILYGLGGLIAGLSPLLLNKGIYPWILGGRIVQGLGAAGTAPIAMALAGDLFAGKERSKALGIIEASNGSGKVVSPILGALLGILVWFAPFLFFPLFIIPVALGIWLTVKEPAAGQNQKALINYFKSFSKVFKKRVGTLLASYFGGMIALLTLFGVLFYLSDYLEKAYNLEGVIKGLALAIPVFFMSITSYITGLLIKKRVRLMQLLVVAGLSLIGFTLITLPMFSNTFLFFAIISFAGIGTGLVLPCLNTFITSSTNYEERGLVTSLYGSVRFLGVAIGPPVFGLLMDFSKQATFWIPAIVSLISALLAFLFIKANEMVQNP